MPSDAAQAYESALVPTLFRPQAERAVELMALAAGECLLDVGCGTGIGARIAAQCIGAGGRVAGIDSDAAMLDVARRAAGYDRGAPIEWQLGDAARMPFDDATFDACLCLQSLQFFADRAQALGEMQRTLRPGGRIVVSVWSPLDCNPGHRAFYESMTEQGLDTVLPRRGFELRSGELCELVEDVGLRVRGVHEQPVVAEFLSVEAFVAALAAGAPYTRRVLSDIDRDARKRCLDGAVRRLRPLATDGPLKLPTQTVLLHAER